MPLERRAVKTGYISVASPELTIFDLLTYRNLGGGLNSIATVLSELMDAVDANRLLEVINNSSENAWWQRLGYLIEHIDPTRERLLVPLRQYANTQSLRWVPLASELPVKNAKRDESWKIIANTTIEVDE